MRKPLRNRERKPYIIVFWEGESEKEYMRFMRDRFHEYLNLTVHNKKGTFNMAKKSFSPNGIYADDASEVDAVWFIFDTEPELRAKWDEYKKIIQTIRRKCKSASVRLLMTKGCIEYFFLLHYEKCRPQIQNKADKERVMQCLTDTYCPAYKKGDPLTISEIAQKYEAAVKNGTWCMRYMNEELRGALNDDERNQRMFISDRTFSNVHEGLEYLIDLEKRANDIV